VTARPVPHQQVAIDLNTPTEIEQRGFGLFLFLLFYLLGSLGFLFAFLLSFVPHPLHGGDHTLQYICWSGTAASMAFCIVIARRWGIRNPFRRGPASPIRFVMQVAWVEMVYSATALIDLVLRR
jgi:hypothetical protein